MSARTALRAIVTAAIALALQPTAAFAEPTTLEIPVMLPLTGVAAFIGKGQSASLGVLENMTNAHGGIQGHPVKFVIEDDQSSPANAVQFAGALIGKKVPIFLGPAFTAQCLAVAPLVKSGPVQYCLSPGVSPAAGSWTYGAGIAGTDFPMIVLHYFAAKHFNRIAIIASADASGQNFEQSLDQTLARPEFKAIQLVAREHFAVTDLSVDAQLSRIKAAAPDAVIEWTAGTAFATLLRGTQEVGIDVPILGGNGNMTYAQMAQYARFLPHELLFPATSPTARGGVGAGPIRDAQRVYFAAFKAAGIQPDFQSALVWDPAMIVLDAYRALGVTATADQLQAYLQHLHSWIGISGVYDFRDGSQRGIGYRDGIIARWDPAKNDFVAVSRLGGYPK